MDQGFTQEVLEGKRLAIMFVSRKRLILRGPIFHYSLCLVSVLRSEMEDEKCMLQAAERQVGSLKKERDLESIETGRRLASLESKVWEQRCTMVTLKAPTIYHGNT